MRKILGAHVLSSTVALSTVLFGAGSALADSSFQNYSQFGLNLPQIAVPYGQDEVRAMDGTYCRSSVSNGGAYMDMGMMGNGGGDDMPGGGAVYGRVIVPLGKKPGRIDCTALYNLEIERLRLELQLTKMGISGGARPSANSEWQNSGWSSQGRTQTLQPPE